MARTVFAHANLLDGEHPAKPDATIVVEGDRIVAVASGELEAAPGDRVVDCGGRTVLPGMVSGHFHSTYHDVTAALIPPLGLEHPPAYQAYIAAYNARQAVECGVTSVVGANEAWDVDPSLRDAIDDGLVVGPRVVPGSRELITSADSNDTVPWWYEAQALGGARVCNGPDEFRRAVREEIKRGAEIIKLFATGGHGIRHSRDTTSITREEMRAAIEAAHNLGKRVRAHVASKAGIMLCLELGVDVLDHADGLDEEAIAACAETGTIIIPSLYAILTAVQLRADDPARPFDSPMGQQFRAMCDVLPAAVEAGATICTGDDYGTNLIPHGAYGGELAMYVEHAGIPPLEVLRWATVNGGALVGLDDLGRIEAGARADLVVVDGDPSADIGVLADRANVRLVMVDGEIRVER